MFFLFCFAKGLCVLPVGYTLTLSWKTLIQSSKETICRFRKHIARIQNRMQSLCMYSPKNIEVNSPKARLHPGVHVSEVWMGYLLVGINFFLSLSLLSSICCSSSSPNLPPLLKQVQKLSLVKSLLKCKELRAGSINPGRLEGIRRWRSSKSSAVGQFMTLTCITYSSSHQHWLLLNDQFFYFFFILFISFIRCIYYTYAKVD